MFLTLWLPLARPSDCGSADPQVRAEATLFFQRPMACVAYQQKNWHGRIEEQSRELFPLSRSASECLLHIKRGQVTVLDHVGAELTSREAAENAAVRRGQDITQGDPLSADRIIVADADWQTVYKFTLQRSLATNLHVSAGAKAPSNATA